MGKKEGMNGIICDMKPSGRCNSAATESMGVKAGRLTDALEEGIRVFLSVGKGNLGDLDMQIQRESRKESRE